MSAATNKAVFLSYASQDAAAALRICEALRTAGIEVWFDQSELRGGDAWDAKIRKQIKECALFVPIISANTQARAEGYFRLEWKLADRRMDLIGKSKAFLLPLCIDDTPEDAADVPDSFLAVQWMRLRNDDAVGPFCARVHTLLDGEHVDVGPAAMLPQLSAAPLRAKDRRLPVLWAALVCLGVTAGLGWWRPWKREVRPVPAQASPMVPVPTEAQKLIQQAWKLLYKPEFARAELGVAEALCKQAAALSPNDPEVWAAWTYADTWLLFFQLDDTPQRRALAEEHAARGVKLDPQSVSARVTQAFYWNRGSKSAGRRDEAERVLRDVLKEYPDEPRALFALGCLVGLSGGGEALFERLAVNPRFTALALNELAWYRHNVGDFDASEQAVDRSITAYPYWHNLSLKAWLAANWHGDTATAKALLERVPANRSHEDWMALFAVWVHFWRRDPQSVLMAMQTFPRDWIDCHPFHGPKAFMTARARAALGQKEPAQREARYGIAQIDKRLLDAPNDENLLAQKALLLDLAGDRADAEKTYRLVREIGGSPKSTSWGHKSQYELVLRFEPADVVLTDIERGLSRRFSMNTMNLTAASLRTNPVFDSLRDHPRFKAALASAEADPRWSPRAGTTSPGRSPKP